MEPVTFRHSPEHGLDLTLRPARGPARAVVLYLHGGGFRKGAREGAAVAALAARLGPEGIAVASADYRLGTGATVFAPVERQAIRRMQARSAAVGLRLNPRLCGPAFAAALLDASSAVAALGEGRVPGLAAGLPVIVLGVSAGGILALSLCWPPAIWAARLARPAAAMAVAATMVQPWRLAADGPPAILLHASADRIIPPADARLAAARAAATGAPLDVIDSGTPGHNRQLALLLEGADAAGRPWFDRLLALVAQAGARPSEGP